jgi:RNA polymerase sigma-70 factor, ECF subfamily
MSLPGKANESACENMPVIDEQLVSCWYGRVFALCQATLRSRADAEDAAQETFVRGLGQLEQVRSPQAIGAWFRGIARHVCVDTIRRDRIRQTPAGMVDDLPDATENAAVTRDEQEFLVGLIHELPETLREVVLLHYYENLTYDEMANWLGVARSTVNERLSKARALLKGKIQSPEACDEL